MSHRGLQQRQRQKGLFGAFYTDWGGHYFITPTDARKVDKTQLTQVGRALPQLGFTHIPSYSPQGRGRMERVFGTPQKRLPQELRLARIKTVAAANRYLRERFVPDYNARFAVPPAEPGSASRRARSSSPRTGWALGVPFLTGGRGGRQRSMTTWSGRRSHSSDALLSTGDKVADTRSRPPGVCPVGDCLFEFVVVANCNQPQGFELTLTATAGKEISTRDLAAPTGPEAPMLEVSALFERGALCRAVVGRQEDVRLVVEIDADIYKVPFGEEARDEVPD